MAQRKAPPAGFVTSTQAMKILGNKMLYKYVDKGLISPHGTEASQHKYYLKSEVEALRDTLQAFYGAKPESEIDDTDAVFALATLDDMDALVTLAKRLFSSTIGAERRREWMAKEPRGHYIVKKKSGAVVAYFYLQPLNHNKMIDYLEGRVKGWEISADNIERLEPGKPVEVMIGGIGSDPDTDQDTRSNYVAVLLRGIRYDLERMGREGILIDKLYAYSSTLDGIVMCLDLGMQQWKRPKGKRCMFVLDMKDANTFILQGYKRGLRHWQQSHQERARTPVSITPSHTTPQRQKAPTAPPETRQGALSQGNLPAGYVPLSEFYHGMARSTAKRNAELTEGDWRDATGHVVNKALSPEQQHAYYLWAHNRPGFVACSECPHLP